MSLSLVEGSSSEVESGGSVVDDPLMAGDDVDVGVKGVYPDKDEDEEGPLGTNAVVGGSAMTTGTSTTMRRIPVVIRKIREYDSDEGDELEDDTDEEEEMEETVTLLVPEPSVPSYPIQAAPYVHAIEETGKKITNSITSAGSYIANSIYEGKERIKSSIEPRDDPIEVPAVVQTALDKTRSVIPIINKAGAVVIDGISEWGSKPIASALNKIYSTDTEASTTEEEPQPSQPSQPSRMAVVTSIAGTGLREGYNVFTGVLSAGGQIFTASKDSIAEIVNHRFGLNASQVTDKSLSLGQEVVSTTQYIKSAGYTVAANSVTKAYVKSTRAQPIEIELEDLQITNNSNTEIPKVGETENSAGVKEIPQTDPNNESAQGDDPPKGFWI